MEFIIKFREVETYSMEYYSSMLVERVNHCLLIENGLNASLLQH